MAEKYELDGFVFLNKEDFERAKKERETVLYLKANTDMTNMKEVYKVYKRAIEGKSFQTVFGLKYMEELRDRIEGSGIIKKDILPPIPVAQIIVNKQKKIDVDEKNALLYKEKYEKEKSNKIIKNVIIAVLCIVIGAMIFITYKSQYSVFTYFTDYKEKMRSEITDEYEKWEAELEDREKALEDKEKHK